MNAPCIPDVGTGGSPSLEFLQAAESMLCNGTGFPRMIIVAGLAVAIGTASPAMGTGGAAPTPEQAQSTSGTAANVIYDDRRRVRRIEGAAVAISRPVVTLVEALEERYGLTRSQVADALQVSRPTLYKWLAEPASTPHGVALRRMATVNAVVARLEGVNAMLVSRRNARVDLTGEGALTAVLREAKLDVERAVRAGVAAADASHTDLEARPAIEARERLAERLRSARPQEEQSTASQAARARVALTQLRRT